MLGMILKELRADKHITQVQLAEKLNVKQSTISSWEIERTSPTLEQLGDLANIFDVTCDYLIGRTTDYGPNGELTPSYKRRMKVQNSTYTLGESLDIMRKFCEPGNVDKEKLAAFFETMHPSDFLELCNAVAAFIDSKD